ncbi:MOSC N-terminal beta barrel domain-containing protein [Colletotrichum orchidophilum]|uniref:Molybdenum cofactor sulfurase n=1 Tax=Colletotrichum orchidophilum TaxID=1209926 RepID=A0A1G4BIK4_9PEZI|nr:MOSC N-terminal beta barrel domain-containing protein [Colletotrichum orchidophilum]OHF01279.1 MOSC N-terminal beta barrel domain-containing protein [Colletotrichum orchidophilum]
MVNTEVRNYNSQVEQLRDREYPMIKDSIYLDHAGTTLYAKCLIERFSAELMSNLLGNPHSASSSSQYSTSRIEDTRLRLLRFFNADPEEFDLVFVSNTTAAIKLVSDAFRALPEGFSYVYHEACHTSIIGVREEARESICVANDGVRRWINGKSPLDDLYASDSPTLFSYTAQSHLDGRRYPLTWPSLLRESPAASHGQLYTLMDAASLVATSPLDLSASETAPDFTVLSLYKIFGFPDLGALIVRKQAEPVLNHRRYFGGGTVDMVVCGKERWHSPKPTFLHERLEDGTLPFHNIIGLDAALDVHAELFGNMARVASHTGFLRDRLYDGLASLKHGNGLPVCTIYSERRSDEAGSVGCGPLISFNIRDAAGAWISLYELEKLATLKNLHIRTGGVCSPGGIASALGLSPWEMRKNFSAGFRCGTDQDVIAGKPTGVIRASLGAMSSLSDVDFLVGFIDEFYREEVAVGHDCHVERTTPSIGFQVQGISVYPLKSCGGFSVPLGMAWEIMPEGLAWDREWCLVHQGSGQALSQKRYPKMALIKPTIDFDSGVLRVSYRGMKPRHLPNEISVPLSADPTCFESYCCSRVRSSRVCGDNITIQVYASDHVNGFFSDILGVPCALARFPAGGLGLSMRHSKAKVQKYQHSPVGAPRACLGASPELPSPPDSDSEQSLAKILLSNESPILLINTSSLRALNHEIQATGGRPVPSEAFRANILVGPTQDSNHLPWAEDEWKKLTIGGEDFNMLGSCRRCQMVCVDQESGERHQEPFVTLSKVRRFDGKVYFGTHMSHESVPKFPTDRTQYPVIRVGDMVSVGAWCTSQ